MNACADCAADISHMRSLAVRCESCRGKRKTWLIAKMRDEVAFRTKEADRRARREARDAGTCTVCSGPTSSGNTSGICARTAQCRSAGNALRRRAPKRARPASTGWLIPEDFEDGEPIIDEVAVDLAFRGVRSVCLTPLERVEVVRRMQLAGYGLREMCDHVATISANIIPILDGLGFEVVADELQASSSRRKVIVRKDRVRGTKICDSVGIVAPRLRSDAA